MTVLIWFGDCGWFRSVFMMWRLLVLLLLWAFVLSMLIGGLGGCWLGCCFIVLSMCVLVLCVCLDCFGWACSDVVLRYGD